MHRMICLFWPNWSFGLLILTKWIVWFAYFDQMDHLICLFWPNGSHDLLLLTKWTTWFASFDQMDRKICLFWLNGSPDLLILTKRISWFALFWAVAAQNTQIMRSIWSKWSENLPSDICAMQRFRFRLIRISTVRILNRQGCKVSSCGQL